MTAGAGNFLGMVDARPWCSFFSVHNNGRDHFVRPAHPDDGRCIFSAGFQFTVPWTSCYIYQSLFQGDQWYFCRTEKAYAVFKKITDRVLYILSENLCRNGAHSRPPVSIGFTGSIGRFQSGPFTGCTVFC